MRRPVRVDCAMVKLWSGMWFRFSRFAGIEEKLPFGAIPANNLLLGGAESKPAPFKRKGCGTQEPILRVEMKTAQICGHRVQRPFEQSA